MQLFMSLKRGYRDNHMSKQCLGCFLSAFIIVISYGCNSDNTYFSEESWKNAFKNQKVVEGKPEKLGEFHELFKSPILSHVDEEFLYIYDSKDLVINKYSRQDCRIIGKFGRKGEGPGEFRMIYGFNVYNDFILVNSPGKNSYFSNVGKLLKEEKCPPHLIPCVMVGENFVTDEYDMPPPGGYRNPYIDRRIVLVGPDFKNKKVLFQKKLNIAIVYNPKTGTNTFTLFSDICEFRIYKNNIYIGYANQEGFFFTIFDSFGNLRYKIERPYKKREIPEMLKKAVLKKPYRLRWNRNRSLKLKFYKYLPSFSSFEVADDRVYIFQYPENEYRRILILDLKGKLIDASLIPFNYNILEERSYQIFYADRKIYNAAWYYLHDNDITDRWELWRKMLINTID